MGCTYIDFGWLTTYRRTMCTRALLRLRGDVDEGVTRSGRAYDVAFGVVVFLGLYQGLVPLVVRPLFGADQRFAPALWLPSPWWWIACLAIVVTALALLAVIGQAKERRFPAETEPATAKADSRRGKHPSCRRLAGL